MVPLESELVAELEKMCQRLAKNDTVAGRRGRGEDSKLDAEIGSEMCVAKLIGVTSAILVQVL